HTSTTPVVVRKGVTKQTKPDISRLCYPNMRSSFSQLLQCNKSKSWSVVTKLEVRDLKVDDQ
ncbi:unnamed protein product, partial [Urochloa humidicola]